MIRLACDLHSEEPAEYFWSRHHAGIILSSFSFSLVGRRNGGVVVPIVLIVVATAFNAFTRQQFLQHIGLSPEDEEHAV